MRRTFAATALAVAALSVPSAAQAQRPVPPPTPICTLQEIAQNCVCGLASRALYIATGEYWLHCV